MSIELILLITGVVGLVSAVVAFATKLHTSVQEIHLLVNDRMDTAITRIDQLIAALQDAGVDVPDKPGDT